LGLPPIATNTVNDAALIGFKQTGRDRIYHTGYTVRLETSDAGNLVDNLDDPFAPQNHAADAIVRSNNPGVLYQLRLPTIRPASTC
jgi:hypothetical protein